MQSLKFLLISQSPRRRQILEDAGFKISVDSVKVSESFDKNVKPKAAVQEIARRKARAYLDTNKPLKLQGYLVLSADTIVVAGEQILGKPESAEEAATFLRLLSGKTHSVMTGVYVFNPSENAEFQFVDETLVEFRTLSESEISTYIATGEPFDKAGAYGIQSLGGQFVKQTQGSFLNVVGLPLEKLEQELLMRGWHVDRK